MHIVGWIDVRRIKDVGNAGKSKGLINGLGGKEIRQVPGGATIYGSEYRALGTPCWIGRKSGSRNLLRISRIDGNAWLGVVVGLAA